MCRLLAYAAPAPVRISDVIGAEQCERYQRLGRLHRDGWGSMWVDDVGGPAALARHRDATGAFEDARLREALRHPRSRARAFHLRLATGSLPVNLENTHPFVADGIGLAHNGSIVPSAELRAMLRPEVLAGVEGSTDSELYLGLIRQYVRDGLDLLDSVPAAVTRIRAHYPTASLNAILLTPRELLVVHSSTTATVPWREFAALGRAVGDLPVDHDDRYYRMGCHVAPDGSIAFTSTGLDTTGWAPLPEDSVTRVELSTMRTTTLLLGDAAAVA